MTNLTNHPATDSPKTTTIAGLVALFFFFFFNFFEPTLFSMDFLTRVKLFQRDSNSFLWVPRKNMRSLMICSHKDRQKKGPPWDLFFFSFLQGPYRIITPWIWIKERMTKGAGHLNDDEEGLCVILRVLQNVIWVGEKKPMWINCATQSHSKQK